MKKSLLAVAIVAALPAVAQAQTNVTMFGLLDASLASTDRKAPSPGPGSAIQILSGVAATNRWGVRGSEDLGGGLSAQFHLEGGLNVDDGTGKTGGAFDFTRRALVGLGGGFGTILIGRDYTPGFIPAAGSDYGGYGLWGTNLVNWTSGSNAANGIRWSNGIHWQSPNWGGFSARAAYATGERDVTPKTAGNNIGLALSYAAGPFGGYVFFHDMKDPVAAGAAQTKTKQSGVGGSVQFGPAKILLGYVATDPDGAVKLTGFNLGTQIALGGGTLGLQGTRLKESSVAAKGTSIGISYTRPLSKRTDWYFSAGQMKNNDTGNFALRASDVQVTPGAVGADPRALSIGVLHRF
jgi:predicted porin